MSGRGLTACIEYDDGYPTDAALGALVRGHRLCDGSGPCTLVVELREALGIGADGAGDGR